MLCRECIVHVIKYTKEPEIQCPHENCTGIINDREIRSFTTFEEYEKHLERSLAQAERTNINAYHCMTKNCTGWVEIKSIKMFMCPVCRNFNCVPCRAVHFPWYTCKQFTEKRRREGKVENQMTEDMIEKWKRKEIMKNCPNCNVLIEKDAGCNQMKCTLCYQEFGWKKMGLLNLPIESDEDEHEDQEISF
jgi:RanBP-type and C3HC4-type zinc finger-containing protein 1